MFIVRPAATGDRYAVRGMIPDRRVRGEERGLPVRRGGAEALAARCGNAPASVRAPEREGRAVERATTAHRLGPPCGRPPARPAEPVIRPGTVVARPARRTARPGTPITARTAGRACRAVREGGAPVRRDRLRPALVTHHRSQRLSVVHEAGGPPRRVYVLARRTRRPRSLATSLVTVPRKNTAGGAAGVRGPWPGARPEFHDLTSTT